jgi:hypothetical protein
MEQVFVGLRFKFYSLHPIPRDFERLKKRIFKTKYTVIVTLIPQWSTMLNTCGVAGTRTLPKMASGGLFHADECHSDDMVSSMGGVTASTAGVRVWSWSVVCLPLFGLCP